MSLRPTFRLLCGALPALFIAGLAAAQDKGAALKEAKIEGDALVLVVQCVPGWHIYTLDGEEGNKTVIDVKDGPRKVAGPLTSSPKKHKRKTYEGSDYVEEYDYHDGTVEFRAPLAATGKAGDVVEGTITYMACDDDGCLPIETHAFKAPLGGAKPTSTPAATPGAQGPTGAKKKLDRPKPVEAQRGGDPLTFVFIEHPERVKAGVPFDVTVSVRVKPGWHIYGLKTLGGPEQPTTFDAAPAEEGGATRLRRAGDAKADKEPKFHGAGLDRYSYFEGTTTVVVPFVVEGGGAGKEPFRLVVAYQCCTMESCLPPTEAAFALELDVEAGTAAGGVEAGGPGAGGAASRSAAEGAGAPPTTTPTKTDPAPGPQGDKPKPAPAGGAQPDAAAATPATLRFEPTNPEAGQEADLVVTFRPAAAAPADAKAKLTLTRGTEFGAVGEAKTVVGADGSVVVTQRVKVADQARTEAIEVGGVVAYGGAEFAFSGSAKILSTLLGFIGLAMAAAAFALLTPCVFPMIPVTVSFFTKQAERNGGKNPWGLGLTYAFGIVLSFTIIGVLFTALLGPAGASVFAQHPITQGLIALLFIVFAFSLMGAFEIQLPAFLQNLIGGAQGKGGVGGVLMMGALFSLTTFTCTAAFVGGLLAAAAASGDYLRPVVGMVAFSSVLAIPFVFLSAFPSYLKKMPRSGGWMNEVKVVMGFVELVAAFKFLNGWDIEIFTRSLTLVCCSAIFAACGLYLLGAYRMPHDSPREKTTVTHVMLAIGSFALAVHLGSGIDGSPLGGFIDGYLPVVEEEKRPGQRETRLADAVAERLKGATFGAAGPVGKTGYDRAFKDDWEGAVAEAKRLDKPVFVDFTGFT